MYKCGVEIDRRLLNDRYTVKHNGRLVIMDITDQGRHRPIKVARLMSARGIECELLDVHVVWSNDDRITFTGEERVTNADGAAVCYKQSWLCWLDLGPPAYEPDEGPALRVKQPPR